MAGDDGSVDALNRARRVPVGRDHQRCRVAVESVSPAPARLRELSRGVPRHSFPQRNPPVVRRVRTCMRPFASRFAGAMARRRHLASPPSPPSVADIAIFGADSPFIRDAEGTAARPSAGWCWHRSGSSISERWRQSNRRSCVLSGTTALPWPLHPARAARAPRARPPAAGGPGRWRGRAAIEAPAPRAAPSRSATSLSL